MVLKKLGLSAGVATVLTGVEYWYMTNIKVPAVVAVRPALQDVGFWTGIFSGRGMIYLWLHHPTAMTILGFVLWMLAVFLLTLGWSE